MSNALCLIFFILKKCVDMCSAFPFADKRDENQRSEITLQKSHHSCGAGTQVLDPRLFAFAFCITLLPQITGLSFYTINSIRMFWRFLLFKCKFMENESQVNNFAYRVWSWRVPEYLSQGHWKLYVRKQKLRLHCCCLVTQVCAAPWTVAIQHPLSMRFSRQDYWVDCHFFFRGSLIFKDWTQISFISCTGRQIFCHWTTWEVHETLWYPGKHTYKII